MPEIRKLSSEIIGQIAAGEVVERPASAVKELVENSIDAGATSVTVELREGGIRYLRVSDNGRGIPAEQIRLAFERHATSKLIKIQDLYDIHTLGFRGEALASIAAVAKVTLTTRTEEAAFGTRARVEAGEFVDIRQAASPVGTTIVVEDLFYNAPVRLKFLKKPAMEASMVADYMLRLILSKPEISFRFVSEGKTVYHSMGDGKVESALFCLYGKDALKQMRKVGGHMNGALIDGYVGVGELSRGNRQQQSFFINGRYFKSALLSRALENGCEGRVMIGRFPMCALFLQLPGQQVDVNVHPNKLEVRFQNEPGVAAAVETLVKEAMRRESLGERLSMSAREEDARKAEEKRADESFVVVSLGEGAEASNRQEAQSTPDGAGEAGVEHADARAVSSFVSQREPAGEPGRPAMLPTPQVEAPQRPQTEHAPFATTADVPWRQSKVPQTSVPGNDPVMRSAGPVLRQPPPTWERADMPPRTPAPESLPAAAPEAAQVPEAEQTTLLEKREESGGQLRLAGIVFDTYWIFETDDRLLLVDQHAAHERILFDRLMARFEGGHISQRLLSPQIVRLTAHDLALATELIPVFNEAGFEIEPFDDTCVAVHAIPTLFGRNEPPRELFLEALDGWQAGRGQVTRERMRGQIAQMACKHAIKGGDKLSALEVEGFLREMLKSEAMPTCPHGRPIVTEITRYALEKRFKRVQ